MTKQLFFFLDSDFNVYALYLLHVPLYLCANNYKFCKKFCPRTVFSKSMCPKSFSSSNMTASNAATQQPKKKGCNSSPHSPPGSRV